MARFIAGRKHTPPKSLQYSIVPYFHQKRKIMNTWFTVCAMLFWTNYSVAAVNTCTDIDNLPFLERDARLPGYEIITLTTEGVMTCARNCLTRSWCKSFNFNTGSRQCELNYARLSPDGLFETNLVVEPDFLFSDINHWPQKVAGTCENHTCAINSRCQPVDNNKYTCVVYVKATSCAEVKKCDPTSTDGEYWIRLLNFDLYRTRIYCHNMSSDSPTEYLTLPNPNYGIYPSVSNWRCNGETELSGNCAGRGGEYWYHKIRVVLETMEVLEEDVIFANITNYKVNYATAVDCYTQHDDGTLSSCGAKGKFTVDLSGTGWAIPTEQQWKASGWLSAIESITRNADGTIMQLKCGGFQGGCRPEGDLLLVPFPEGLSSDSAAESHCVS